MCQTREATAFFRATATRLRARLAMILRVTRTLVAARFAYVGTELTDLMGKLAAARHEARGQTTDRGTIEIVADALRHHLDVGFAQARGRTVVAGVGTPVASIDAGLILLMHGHLLSAGEALRPRSGQGFARAAGLTWKIRRDYPVITSPFISWSLL